MRCAASARSAVKMPPLPKYFVTAQDLTPAEHVRMQAAVQRYVDSAISKTVNVPEDISFEAFQAVYLVCLPLRLQRLHHLSAERDHRVGAGGEAGRTGAGGRGRGSAAAWCGKHDRPDGAPREDDRSHLQAPLARQRARDVRHGERHRTGRRMRRPFEVFVNSKNLEHYAWVVALTRMISGGVPPRRRGGLRGRGTQAGVRPARRPMDATAAMCGSLVAAIGEVHRTAHDRDGLSDAREPIVPNRDARQAHKSTGNAATTLGPLCPKCSQPGLVREAGCLSCVHCGWSRCS